jgi:hypothetical protein
MKLSLQYRVFIWLLTEAEFTPQYVHCSAKVNKFFLYLVAAFVAVNPRQKSANRGTALLDEAHLTFSYFPPSEFPLGVSEIERGKASQKFRLQEPIPRFLSLDVQIGQFSSDIFHSKV